VLLIAEIFSVHSTRCRQCWVVMGNSPVMRYYFPNLLILNSIGIVVNSINSF